MKTINMKVSELKHPDKNIRIHTERQLEEFARSIKMFGQIRPVVVDENNTILAGNGLVLALKKMGEENAIVLKYTNLSENQKKKLMIADNKIFNLGIEDLDTLNHFLQELGDDLDIPGFDEELLQSMVAEAEEVTEKISEYGTLDEDEISTIKANREKKENLISKATEESAEEKEQADQGPYIRTETTNSYTHTDETESADIKKFVLCPKCGEKIWL